MITSHSPPREDSGCLSAHIWDGQSPLHTTCPVQIPAYGYVPRQSVCNGPNPSGQVQSPLQLPAVPPGVRGYVGIPSSFHRALLLKEPLRYCPLPGCFHSVRLQERDRTGRAGWIQGCQLITSPPEKLTVQPCYL